MKIILQGKTFKELIAAVCKFPSVGNFVGADLLHVDVTGGRMTVASVGAVLARGKVECAGALPLIGIDRRTAESFASICNDSKVSLTYDDTLVTLASRGRDVNTPVAKGQKFAIPSLNGNGIKLGQDVAARMSYLADVAFGDSSRPELCCVMMAGKDTVACNQRTVALFRAKESYDRIAVPLLLAKNVKEGDIIYPGQRETVLKSGTTVYAMSTPVKAQKSYPLDAIRAMGKSGRKPVLTVAGDKLIMAVQECSTVIGGLAKTELVVDLSIEENKLWLSAANGSTKFRAPVPILSVADATVGFRAPLDGLMYVAPFMSDKPVGLSQGEHGDMVLDMDAGWVLFPAWTQAKKKGKK